MKARYLVPVALTVLAGFMVFLQAEDGAVIKPADIHLPAEEVTEGAVIEVGATRLPEGVPPITLRVVDKDTGEEVERGDGEDGVLLEIPTDGRTTLEVTVSDSAGNFHGPEEIRIHPRPKNPGE